MREPLHVSIPPKLKAKLKKYFSGKLALVQILAGVGAFAARSLGAYALQDHTTWTIVVISMLGSYVGYIGTYAVGYWVAFRVDYRVKNRSMSSDIIKLQVVEQLPNIGTAVASGLTQGALIGGAGMQPVLAVNLVSWFGPQRIVSFLAMALGNSLKRAWVDGTWKPTVVVRSIVDVALRLGRGGWKLRY